MMMAMKQQGACESDFIRSFSVVLLADGCVGQWLSRTYYSSDCGAKYLSSQKVVDRRHFTDRRVWRVGVGKENSLYVS
jgi:hypothetical protein